MTIEIREGDRKAAFDAALNAYGPDSLYVPPLWSDFDRMFDDAKNPLSEIGTRTSKSSWWIKAGTMQSDRS